MRRTSVTFGDECFSGKSTYAGVLGKYLTVKVKRSYLLQRS